MNLKSKRELYRHIIALITENRLKAAFEKLRDLAATLPADGNPGNLDPEEDVYGQMIRYFIMNAPDPDRDMLKDGIRRKMLRQADHIFARSLSASPTDLLYTYRKRYDNPARFDAADLERAHHLFSNLSVENQVEAREFSENLFFELWMTPSLSQEKIELLQVYLCKNEEDEEPVLGSLLTSALILHSLEKFSQEVWMLLADIYESGKHQLWQRALIGMLLSVIRFEHRLSLYPAVGSRMQVLSGHEQFIQHMETAAIQLIRTGDTEKISKRVQEEIIPEMMKLAPRIREKLSLDQFLQDETGEDKNPEWEKFFEESPGVYEKMEEMNKLQSEGADLFISTFSQLKHFPFFRTITHWFLPFIPHHPALIQGIEEAGATPVLEGFFEVFSKFPVMCNSDKYSLCFNLTGLPEEQQRMITGALSGEMLEMNRVSDADALVSPTQGEEVFHQYTQDLYRFFRVHPSHPETEDPFAMKRQLYQCQSIKAIMEEHPVLMRRIAEYYFQQEHYPHAIHLFGLLEQTPQDNPELFQKLAYAWQMSGDLDKALAYYRKAELFDSNALWNLRKIAWCHHLKNDLPGALKAYKEAELLDPESVQIKLNIGNLLLQLTDWDEALHYYLKAEELRPGDIKTLRPVAWCLFLQGEMETAVYYYEQILELKFNQNDLLNFGHVRFVLGQRDEALKLYRESLLHRKNSPERFQESFNSDRVHLERLGVPASEAAFMLDAVLFEI